MEEAIKIGDKVYTLSPISAGDMESLRLYVQYLPYHTLIDARDDFPDQDLVNRQAEKLFDECSRKKITDEEIKSALDSLPGVIFIVWCSVRKRHPDLTRCDVGGLLNTGDSIADISRKIALISGWKVSEPAQQKKTKHPPKSST